MRFNNLKFWSSSQADNSTTDFPQTDSDHKALHNVVPLSLGTSLDNPAGLVDPVVTPANPSDQPVQKEVSPQGPMAAPQLKVFFANNFLGIGRHNGSNYKTQEALEQGKAMVVARFQNAVAAVIDQKQAKVDSLRNVELQTEGVCSTASGQLRLACRRLERDIATLQNQIELATQGKGWVLASLNEYQIGFGKGMREAIEAELLGL